jgi:hypothetical protein
VETVALVFCRVVLAMDRNGRVVGVGDRWRTSTSSDSRSVLATAVCTQSKQSMSIL